MEEISSSDYNNTNNINNDITDSKIYPTTLPTKGNSNSLCDIHAINKKNSPLNMNNNAIFKITEKECSDINLIVRNSVEKINDLLNSKEFNNNNFSRTLKRSSKNVIAEILEKERVKEKEKILKTKTLKESGMKTNVTFNINNFINVPNEQSKNESINKKAERYEDEDEYGITNELTFSEKPKNNGKAKSNQKGNNIINRKNNYINYGTNKHNNGKLFRNCVRKKKLFDDGMSDNYNNNINIVNYKNNQKIKKCQEVKEDKDKSITVNTKYKKNKNGNENSNYVNDNYMLNKDKNLNPNNNNTLNNSIKNKSKNSNILKYSISEDINNMKVASYQKNNIINVNNFSPNIININSLSDNRNFKNCFINNNNNNNKENENNNNNKPNKQNINNSVSKNSPKSRKNKSKEKQSNKKIFSPQNNKKYNNFREEKQYYNNIYLVNNKNDEKYEGIKKYKNSFLPVNNPINNKILNNNDNKSLFSKTFSNQNNAKNVPFNNININNNDSSSNLDDTQKRVNNKPILKKEKSGNIKKCGYSCEHSNKNNNLQNRHQILNEIYSKEFPNKIKTNNIMKLMLFLNEYLINNNLLDDYHDINNRNKLDCYSKFISDQINIDFPQEDDVGIDKMVNSAKKIQRMWRKKKIEKFIGKNNEEKELKKMVINKYIRNAGFKVKKIIGLFNTLVESFNNIGNEKEMEEMFYNIQQIIKRKLTPYEKNNLYKEYINSIIYLK